jgi:hypothetical protein
MKFKLGKQGSLTVIRQKGLRAQLAAQRRRLLQPKPPPKRISKTTIKMIQPVVLTVPPFILNRELDPTLQHGRARRGPQQPAARVQPDGSATTCTLATQERVFALMAAPNHQSRRNESSAGRTRTYNQWINSHVFSGRLPGQIHSVYRRGARLVRGVATGGPINYR